jgi:biopolymer transport protein ExbD
MSGSVDSADGEIGFQIAPMVDVVFVLMLFFMAAAGARVMEKEIGVNLPAPPGRIHDPEGITLIVVEIGADGQVVANNTAFGTPTDRGLASLRDWLKTTQSFGGKDLLIIRPNAQAQHERIVEVLDACAAAGIKDLTFG